MLSEGQILDGKYRVGRLLSQGGMGAVFLGEHTRIKRRVAVKVLHEHKADSENARRFEREAEAAGRIGSDHICEVLDFGSTPEGDRFMVMEFLDGETLKTRLKDRGRLEPTEIARLVSQVLEGLAAAHAAQIIHRDLKPDNVFILKTKAGRPDFVKIVDFGISKFDSLSNELSQVTQTGAVMGTPYYMSPEQARATNEVDHRSDLYSVGVLMYEAVTGAVPFNGTTLTEFLFKIVFEEPTHPSKVIPSLDRDFAALVVKAISRDPAQRFQSAKAMQEALEGWLRARLGFGAPTSSSPAVVRTTPMDVPGVPLSLDGRTAVMGRPPLPPTWDETAARRQAPRIAETEPLVTGAPATWARQPPPRSSRRGGGAIAILAGVFVILAIGVAAGVFLVQSGFSGRSSPTASPAAAPDPASTPAATAGPTVTPAPSAAPTATAAPSEPSAAPSVESTDVAPDPLRGPSTTAPLRPGRGPRSAPPIARPVETVRPTPPPTPTPNGAATVKDFGY